MISNTHSFSLQLTFLILKYYFKIKSSIEAILFQVNNLQLILKKDLNIYLFELFRKLATTGTRMR